ncbi:odorant receptor coreceptor [Cryptotermes secundus]|uniref:odorant receptor coreceptor n=1 Tax=Cryptotermes secundus TaxID=105785 RepID=UPI000CD7B8B5|nr:odorant receptor coreceptor [Cryptotermes secundus]
MYKFRLHGLVADLWPLIRIMQMIGFFLLDYHEDMSFGWTSIRAGYAGSISGLMVIQFALIAINLMKQADDVNDLTANTITVLFFVHSLTKYFYFALRRGKFYRTLATWNNANSHPLFSENHSRHHATAVASMRRLVIYVTSATVISGFAWTIITFIGDSVHETADPENANETILEEVPRLMLRSWYPWNALSGGGYIVSFIIQIIWLFLALLHAMMMDTMFCCWLIYTCEQLIHLKEIMKPLMELSASLDTLVPHSAELFRAVSATANNPIPSGDSEGIRAIYSNQHDFSNFRLNTGTLANVNSGSVGPNGLTKKQEILVRSAIKYWVERHKHVVRFVGNIGDTYGSALLLHMLTSTVTLTLLAYQATKIEAVDVYACSVIGYLVYTLGQVFLFCFFGNRLIEESSSVMEAAYSCQWYDGSEEAKTFIQIVCQQCQKAMSISGAKFFTVSLDLFASVLGAVVTYFMVLVQLN